MRNLPNPFPSISGDLLLEYYNTADLGKCAAIAYAKDHGFNMKLVEAFAGTLSVRPCSFDGTGFFDFDTQGEPCLVFEVLDEDNASTVDLAAFALADPTRFGTADGTVGVLGLTNVTNPATWSLGALLKVHRTPLSWLRDGCRGVVITDHQMAPEALSKALGPIAAEDRAHAQDLIELLCKPPVDPRSIVVPHVRRAA